MGPGEARLRASMKAATIRSMLMFHAVGIRVLTAAPRRHGCRLRWIRVLAPGEYRRLNAGGERKNKIPSKIPQQRRVQVDLRSG